MVSYQEQTRALHEDTFITQYVNRWQLVTMGNYDIFFHRKRRLSWVRLQAPTFYVGVPDLYYTRRRKMQNWCPKFPIHSTYEVPEVLKERY